MLSNGLYVVIDTAVRAVNHPMATRHRKTLIFGAFREDSGVLPVLKIVYPYLSLTHFYRPGLPGGLIPFLLPGARLRCSRFFGRAVLEYKKRREASAFIHLGRAMHFLIDMACPVHAQRVMHTRDPYEWAVEAGFAELRRLPAVPVERHESPAGIVESMACYTQRFPADGTNHGVGWVLRRLGLRRPVEAAEARRQAFELIPVAAGYAAELLHLFFRKAS